jgi:hypothetical protein
LDFERQIEQTIWFRFLDRLRMDVADPGNMWSFTTAHANEIMMSIAGMVVFRPVSDDAFHTPGSWLLSVRAFVRY